MTGIRQDVSGPEYTGALENERIALAFKALAHPARIAILKAIGPRERACCGEIVDALPLAQSTVSQHLQILRDAGLIKGEHEGRRSCFCINGEAVAAVSRMAATLFADLEQAAEKCAEAKRINGICCASAPEGTA